MTHHQYPEIKRLSRRSTRTLGQFPGAHIHLALRLAGRSDKARAKAHKTQHRIAQRLLQGERDSKQAEIRSIQKETKWSRRRQAFYAIFCQWFNRW